MPHCLRCSKKFKDNMRVLAHMNHPDSSCHTYTEELISIRNILDGKRHSPPNTSQEHTKKSTENTPNGPRNEVPLGDPMDVDLPHDADDSELNGTPISEFVQSVEKFPFTVELYPGASQTYGTGPTFMDKFAHDVHANEREQVLYYPFSSRDEWEMASYLIRSSLSMAAIDRFLKLSLVKQLQLSFHTAKELRSRIELLPAGPIWKSKPWSTALMESPLVKDFIKFQPFRLFRTAEKLMRVYTEWLSGNVAWSMQDQLPPGATIIGTVLSSDKTTISAMTGNRSAHALLISLANLDMDFRMKASNHVFLLLALLPIPKFTHPNKKLHGILEARLLHECLDFVLQPLKKAAEVGIMMTDPLGYRRYCFTPLAAYIVDTPESGLLAGVAKNVSSVTMASQPQFGDNFRHEPRTASTTIAQLQVIESKADPWDLDAYMTEANVYRLNGVHRPFFCGWPMSDPSRFLTPEPLHHWHKGFWDHDARWCINIVGKPEIDFRFAVLHPHTGFRHFKEGISGLKQVTGCEHRDVQRYIIPVIDGAAPKDFVIAVRALMDFRYLAQADEIDDDVCGRIDKSLKLFHQYKRSIIESGARRGKKKAITNWHIPKLEFLQSVVSSIRENGAAIQWSADITEHAHITEIKDPAHAGNNQNYETQICRHLDRTDKCKRFDLATSVCDAHVDFRGSQPDDDEGFGDDEVDLLTTTSSLLERLESVSPLSGSSHVVDYFDYAARLQNGDYPAAPFPFRTLSSSPNTAFHLTRDPQYKRMLIDDAATTFGLPDLRLALSDYLHRTNMSDNGFITSIGGRRTSHEELPFTHIQVWTRVRLQSKAYHHPHRPLPPKTINASPPSDTWPLGCYDGVLVNTDPSQVWPYSGIQGHTVAQLRLIMRIISPHPRTQARTQNFLTYVQRLDIIPQLNPAMLATRGAYPDPVTSLYAVKRAKRANQMIIGDIVPLSQIRALLSSRHALEKRPTDIC
ncbi:hypothetical protein Hypma_007131 [Hypsizygus marmoreus]|uniref:DUF6830 domain-containing protein n=1 Tax=Hypsizygus marmoreus TaxID=39966 RepID=A0A369K6R8_HYPMA|nr:hypothetical protein Hypma_007131 [Hypsizygus marmoreus]